MSMITKMSIQGVRSFGVKDKDTQYIKFEHPLTLLVGPNGAGKTTVIECLKYITTGDWPSNCNRGKNFCHDPKLIDEVEVKAKVVLQYFNLEGDKCQITRCFKGVQETKGVKIQTLDGFIAKHRDGVRSEITSKCSDLNIEMSSALGVSKAILDNVIFCHQEESNWPLDEGGAVKKKFDEIFAATRYNNASDAIKKVRKEQEQKRKEFETRLEYLRKNKDEAFEKRKKLEQLEMKLSNSMSNEKDLSDKLPPLKQQIAQLKKEQTEVFETDQKLKNLTDKKNLLCDSRNRLKDSIIKLFNGTDEQLEELKRTHSSSTNQKENEKRNAEKSIATLEEKAQHLANAKTNLIKLKSKLEQEKDSIDKTSEKLKIEISQYCDAFGMSPQPLDMDDDSAIQSYNDISSFDENILNEHARLKKSLDASVEQIQSQVNEVWKQQTELEEGIKHKQESLREKKTKHENTKAEIERLKKNSNSSKIDQLKKELDKAEKDLTELENNSTIESLKRELKECENEKRIKEKEIKQLDEQIEQIQKFSEQRSKIDFWKSNLTSREETVRKLKSKHSEALKKIKLLKPGSSKQNYPTKNDVQKWIMQKESEIKKIEAKIKKKRDEFSKLSAQREYQLREIKDKENRKNEIDDETFDLCGSQQFEDELVEVQTTVKKLQEDKGVTDGMQFMYKKYLDKLKPSSQDSQEVGCPLCHRLFTRKQDIDELAEELEQSLQLVPQNLQDQEQELTRMQEKLEQLLQHKPKKEEYDELNSTVIPDLRKKQTDLSSKVSSVKSELEGLESTMISLKDEVETARPCLSDLAQIDSSLKEISEAQQNISKVESKLPQTDSLASFDEINQEKKTKQNELQTLSSEIENKRDTIDQQTEALQRNRDRVNQLRTEKHELDSDLQRLEQLKETRSQLEQEYKKMHDDVKQSIKNKEPIEKKLKELEKKKKESEASRTEQLRDSSIRVEKSRNAVQNMSHYISNIKQYQRSGNKDKLNKTTQQLNKLETEFSENEKKLNKSREIAKKLENDIASFEKRQRDISDNIQLRVQEGDIIKVDHQIDELRRELSGVDPGKLEGEITELNQNYTSKFRELEHWKTKMGEYKEQIKTQKIELAKPDYKDADANFRDASIEATLRRHASSDLAKYQTSLDHAIMRYHTLKMNDINNIIKEIWRDTYQGRDIEYIEITSDASSGTTQKRQYNYRVVKVFEGKKTDMRGRCSAGQKVLASLVIRLALAETFCINCGILALDEPTTNLDREHIHALAVALDKIIESRSEQRNFQLLVITHDEDFVECLGRSRHASHFFQICKSPNSGNSTIKKCSISELND